MNARVTWIENGMVGFSFGDEVGDWGQAPASQMPRQRGIVGRPMSATVKSADGHTYQLSNVRIY